MNKILINCKRVCPFIFLSLRFITTPAQAGTFSIPQFVDPGHSAFGLEPEITLSHGAGVGINTYFTQGLSDLLNAGGLIGTGSGYRRFRIGGFAVLDFFPSTTDQIGLGLGGKAVYYRLKSGYTFELTAIPYIHKKYKSQGGNEFDPFISFPMGTGFRNDKTVFILSFAVGSSFKMTDQLDAISELGISIDHGESYFSGGISLRL